jgi:hypothetical protein
MAMDPYIQDTAVLRIFHPNLHERNILVSEEDPTVVAAMIDCNCPASKQHSGTQMSYGSMRGPFPIPSTKIVRSLKAKLVPKRSTPVFNCRHQNWQLLDHWMKPSSDRFAIAI